ncbi:uncharacterized protein Dwil_GK17203 [Drosophila willistoni]|uniref:Protein cueball n=1 Tax=Drosophila willistoni TaxID=7260 RepID=CUE_DROWI|nr:protein cueball [Drosophila willistoni]B4MLE8.1 RecName: Full=Protein cueball; Flags: Precursor [Drosophila willistoni]EDW72804.1 uncharacterized protein Dwil_GK17203 [Drosophila willistoni]
MILRLFILLSIITVYLQLSVGIQQQFEFAITLKSKILFVDEHWNVVNTAAHEFDELSALTFDESEERIYFNDGQHQNSSIFSLRKVGKSNHLAEQTIQRYGNESVGGIAYDPLNRTIYWSDLLQKKIFYASIDTVATEMPKILVDLSEENGTPYGVAIDICGRKLYWTNSNINHPTVERIDLNGTGRLAIIDKNIDSPRGIVVDQGAKRIFWIDDLKGIFFAVMSAQLDGSDVKLVLKDKNHEPQNLAVTRNAIYWTDRTTKSVWSHLKEPEIATTTTTTTTSTTQIPTVEGEEGTGAMDDNDIWPVGDFETTPKKSPLERKINLTEEARGIVARTGFYQLQKDSQCSKVIQLVKQRLDESQQNNRVLNVVDEQLDELQREHCLGGGTYYPQQKFCVCVPGYKGTRCETNECHNFCVHGTCQISEMGYPKCYCQPGYSGERCEVKKCLNFCQNGGDCQLDELTGEASCQCPSNFGGLRCEHNSTEICGLFCRLLKHDSNTSVPFGCHDICEQLAKDSSDLIAIPEYKHLDVCLAPNAWTGSVLMPLMISLILILLLLTIFIHGLRRLYKPKRPHIKKTFVVRKQARTNSSSDTPLTNRPLATEQCEITIENCCNMNICETPCFDPKLVEFAKSNCKDDKKILIHNMEDDLY